MQVYLLDEVGVPEIVCGFRDSKGYVQKIESLNTSAIPSLAKDKWVCFYVACTERL